LVAEATVKIGVVVLAFRLEPWTTNKEPGVEELTVMRELALTVRIEVPEEEAIFRISLEPAVPCKLKVTVEEVALMPATVPLSIKAPLPKVARPVQIATLPMVALVEVVILPPPPVAAMVICPGVEVVMVTLAPATKFPG
jgi:hypothetical protein